VKADGTATGSDKQSQGGPSAASPTLYGETPAESAANRKQITAFRRIVMNDFLDLLRTFGQACLKVLVAMSVGFGVGLLTVGVYFPFDPSLRGQYGSPPAGGLFIAVGVGLLASALMLMVLFFGPGTRKTRMARQRDADGPTKDAK
jgi:hypothetical protein